MKKLSVMLLCVLLAVVLVIPAFAANETVFTVTANKASVAKGDEVTFTVNVSGANAFDLIGVQLAYDTDVFELVSGECSEIGATFADFTNGFAFAFKESVAFEGKIGQFTLRAKTGCPTTSKVSLETSLKLGTTKFKGTVNPASVAISGGHTYGNWASADAENHTRTCSDCGKTETVKHTWVDGDVLRQPTCAVEGQKKQTCDCGATKLASIPTNDAHTFDAGKVTTEPGCESAGEKTYTCTNGCGKKKTEAIKAIGHKYGEGVVTTEPGCETKGVKTYTCANGCGKPKTEEIKATGHNYDEGVITTKPGCETEGVKTYTCTKCDAKKTEKVASTGHKYGEGEVTTKPGCETEGEMTKTCINGCGKKKTEVIKPTGHTPAADAVVTQKPTCEKPGTMTGNCATCGVALTNKEIPALGHEYELSKTVDPTCETAGSKIYVCKNDASHTYQEPIAALGHTYGDWAEADEKEHKHTCATCGDVEKAAHTWDSGFVTKEATCAEEGEKLYTCTDKCGAKKTEVIPATGSHDADVYADNEDGKTHSATCACGEVITEEHAYLVNGDVIVKPTTSSEGQQEMLCVCGAKIVKTLPKLEGELDEVPKTGDITGQVVLFAFAIVATMTAAGYGMKRVFGK